VEGHLFRYYSFIISASHSDTIYVPKLKTKSMKNNINLISWCIQGNRGNVCICAWVRVCECVHTLSFDLYQMYPDRFKRLQVSFSLSHHSTGIMHTPTARLEDRFFTLSHHIWKMYGPFRKSYYNINIIICNAICVLFDVLNVTTSLYTSFCSMTERNLSNTIIILNRYSLLINILSF